MAFTYVLANSAPAGTDPAGTDFVSLGDDQIRTLKSAVFERVNSRFVDINSDPWVMKSPLAGSGNVQSVIPTSDNLYTLGEAARRWSDVRAVLGTFTTLTVTTLTGNVTGNVTGSSGSTTGNAATATALQTARAINGVNFDGTAGITVTAAAGTLSGATLAAGVTASSLTSVGTLLNLTVTNPITGSVTGSSGSTTGSSASTTGNAATATILQTARTINGVSFNGSANITIAAAAGTLTGATLAAGVTGSSLTSVGTLVSLVVTGSVTASSFFTA